jgi:large subunit ribosomal protein L7/L12
MAQDIVGLTLLEAQELKTILKDEYGIEPAAGGAVMMAGPADGGAAEEERLNLTSSSSSPALPRST